jgi:S-disulfanyl-L-cysteine oxidoreductase SoxD
VSTSNRGGGLTAAVIVIMLTAAGTIHAQAGGRFAGIGRAATPAEIRAWNIDVRPDFTGLPSGSGSVARGKEIWDAQCASCHGFFGESNEVFNPVIGGTTPDDVKTGVVKSLTTSELQRTTMMKLSSLATMWDYIRRAMPWNAPKSLSNDDVYAVSAYILHLADLVPAGFVLSDANIRETEKLLPNRNGMTRGHGLWKVDGKPDVKNAACMKNCDSDVKLQSFLPDYARNAHGNLALQNRVVGGVRGADTTRPASAPFDARSIATAARSAASPPGPAALATQQGCLACHGLDKKLIGPGFREIAARYRMDAADTAAVARLAGKIRTGGSGNWGDVAMPPQAQLGEMSAEVLARWIAMGAP